MPSRKQVQIACERCRQRREKCSGEQPCRKCEQRGDTCEYNCRRRVSKSELRAEIQRLRQNNLEDEVVSRGLGTSSTTNTRNSSMTQSVLQDWINGIKTQNAHVVRNQPPAGSMAFSSNSALSGVSFIISPALENKSSSSPSCFGHLLSCRSCCPIFQEYNNATSADSRSLAETVFPSASLGAYGSLSQTDVWTQTGWTRAHIRYLFDVLSTWDNIAFSLLRKDEFLQSYDEGSTRFCPSALVYALLALSMRVINEMEDKSDVLSPYWFGSRSLLVRAEILLRSQDSCNSLPDIQAIGILALYHIRCGREKEAKRLAEMCSSSIRALCLRDTIVCTSDEQYLKVRATVYCGALSLLRLLCLATGMVFNKTCAALQEDGFILDQLPYSHVGIKVATADKDTSKQFASPQLLNAKIFQLTEWVHKFIAANQKAPKSDGDEILSMYIKCLGWYRDLFELVGEDRSRKPFILFVHMYYHFCLLCVFSLFVGSAFDVSELRPHTICAEAVQSILSLAEAYDNLFTLRRVSTLVPYFVRASGLFSLAIECKGAYMNFDISLAQMKLSAVTQARLLLPKMGSNHLMAAIAEANSLGKVGGGS